jgi:hypothetical protein
VRALGEVWSDPSVRMNEGGCDPDGRFYCGSMAYDQREGAASLYRLDTDGGVQVVLEGFGGSGKPTVKVTNAPSVVRVNGLNGTDTISGNGMFGSPTSMHLELAGGFGNDYIEGGLLAGDRLQGDDGDDGFFTRDGQPGDVVSGGVGFDHAAVDVSDQASGVEKFNQAIGTLKLAPATVTAKHRAATIGLSWTHPTG